jgi:hypothetical protein
LPHEQAGCEKHGLSYSLATDFCPSLVTHMSYDTSWIRVAVRLELNEDQPVIEAEPNVDAPLLIRTSVKRCFASPLCEDCDSGQSR